MLKNCNCVTLNALNVIGANAATCAVDKFWIRIEGLNPATCAVVIAATWPVVRATASALVKAKS